MSSSSSTRVVQRGHSYSASRQWSSESSCADHRDVQASAMGIDASGELALLGGRRCIALVHLKREDGGGGNERGGEGSKLDISLRHPRGANSRWDVTKISWCPLPGHQERVAVASHDKVDLVTATPSSLLAPQSLAQHTRLVSDIDWNKRGSVSSTSPVLATASIDSFVHLWDLRTPRKPCASLCTMVPASQVQWSRHDDHGIILTAHEGDLKLWDFRQPSLPTHYVTAHLSRILSLDWSRTSAGKFVTTSQDCTVKFFDLASPDINVPEQILRTEVPVWKARYTPFGKGLVTVILPQLQRKDHSLFLWTTSHLDYPIHCFYGHVDVVLDYDWLRRGEEAKDYEMVSWGRDQTLRLWRVPPNIQAHCDGGDTVETSEAVEAEESTEELISKIAMDGMLQGVELQGPPPSTDDQEGTGSMSGSGLLTFLAEAHNEEEGDDEEEESNRTKKAESSSFFPQSHRSSSVISLQQEFQLANVHNARHVRVDSLNWSRRCCKFSAIDPKAASIGATAVASSAAAANVILFSLRVNFPPGYPLEENAPSFTFGKGDFLEPDQRKVITSALETTAAQHVRRNRGCLEPCLRQLDSIVGSLLHQQQTASEAVSEFNDPATVNGSTAAVSSSSLSPPTASPPPPPPLADDSVCYLEDGNYIPYPRTAGASFCGNGALVCFNLRPARHRISASTPRSLAAFCAQMQVQQRMEAYRATQSNTLSMPSMGTAAAKPGDSSSLKRKGRFKVRRVRTGSADDGRPQQQQQQQQQQQTPPLTVQVPLSTFERRLVRVYDVSGLFLFDRDLAKLYVLGPGDPRNLCLENAAVAAREGYPERSHLWQLCAQVAASAASLSTCRTSTDVTPWSHHPLGRPMLTAILDHLLKIHDIQMAALIACIFQSKAYSNGARLTHSRRRRHFVRAQHEIEEANEAGKFWFMQPGVLPAPAFSSTYHTVHSSDLRPKKKLLPPHLQQPVQQPRGLAMVPVMRSESNFMKARTNMKANRSNSWSDPYEDGLPLLVKKSSQQQPQTTVESAEAISEEDDDEDNEGADDSRSLLDPGKREVYERLILCYAEILFNWSMLHERCAVLKYSSSSYGGGRGGGGRHRGLEPSVNCSSCGEKANQGACCRQCRRVVLRCCVCRMSVRGLATRCGDCGHGGHFYHWIQWFEESKREICPTGCGCRCLEKRDKGNRRV